MKTCRYSTIWMGPISLLWTQKNGEHWAAGRIDIRGSHEGEISLPMMLAEDWNRLSIWLSAYTTEQPATLDKILEDYYNDGYKQITWWRER
jgi:hypothetical protein